MKKIISIVMCIAAVFTMLSFGSVSAFAETEKWENGCLYKGDCLVKVEYGTEKLSIKEGTVSIDTLALDSQWNISEINIPSTLKEIPGGVFEDCTSLIAFNVDKSNNFYSAKNGVLFNKNKTKLVCFPQALVNRNYTVPKGVKTIGESAFYGCTGIKKSLSVTL